MQQRLLLKGLKKTNFSNGKKHDFRLFKESKINIHPDINALTDSAYLGLQKLHAKTQMPKKKSKKKPLTKEDKKNNAKLSSERVINEADRYRNRRKRFSLRFNLIAGIHNWELQH